MTEAVRPGGLLELRAWVRDRDEPVARLARPMACFTRSKKYCLKMFGSRVVPDLDDTTNSVRPRSTCASHPRTWAGSVESSTESSGQPGSVPNVMRRTSGQRLEPPIPRRRTCVKPACRTYLGDAPELAHPRGLLVGDPEPPEPARLIGARPEGGVARPEPLDLALLAPRPERA